MKVIIIRKLHGNVLALSVFFLCSLWKQTSICLTRRIAGAHNSVLEYDLGKHSSPSNLHRLLIHNNLELLCWFKLYSYKQITDKPQE